MSADTQGETVQEPQREASSVAYDRVLETIRQQTGGEQPGTIPESHLRQVCCSSGSLDVDEYRAALEDAVQNGDVCRWQGQLVLVEPDAIVAALEDEADADHPRSSFIARLNKLLQESRGSS